MSEHAVNHQRRVQWVRFQDAVDGTYTDLRLRPRDARLIKAAPELLETLQQLVFEPPQSPAARVVRAQRLRQKARALIASIDTE